MSDDDDRLAMRSERLYYRYARAIDEGDVDTARTLAIDDVQVTLGLDAPTVTGIDHFLDIFHQHKARLLPASKHLVSNVLAERAEDRITTHASFQAAFFAEDGTRLIYGVYHDVHVEVDDEIKIAHKKIVVERVLQLPAAALPSARVLR